MAEVIKRTAYKVTRVGEMIGTEVARRLGVPFGVADLSLAPTPAVGDSVGEIFQSVGLSSHRRARHHRGAGHAQRRGEKGRRFRLLLTWAACPGPSFRYPRIPALRPRPRSGRSEHLEKLEAMTSVCSVGLDMIAIPGDTPAATIAGHHRR